MKRFTGLVCVSLLQIAACAAGTPPATNEIPSIASSNPDGTPLITSFSVNPNTTASSSSPLAVFTGDAYKIESFAPGLVMEILSQNFNDGAPIDHYTFGGGSHQLWRFIAGPNSGAYQVQNPASGKCLDIAGEALIAGAAAVLNTCSQATSQQWSAVQDANRHLAFHNVNSGLCLGVLASNPNIGTSLVQSVCSNDVGQKWQVADKTFVSGYGVANYLTDPTNSITSMSLTMTVPAEPNAVGSLFLLLGLQPQVQSASYQPIGLGILEPVLSWGGSCASTVQPTAFSTWWISGQYVSGGTYPNHSGCLSGNALPVSVGDTLAISLNIQGTVWTQTILDVNTGKSVTYSLDMLGQTQTNVLFDIVQYSVSPVADTVFQNIQITVAQPDRGFCVPVLMGMNDYATPGVVSADMRTCKIAKLILRAQGVAATTPN